MAIMVLIVGFATPRSIDRRKAVVLSREGDRYSTGIRMVGATGACNTGGPTIQTRQVSSVPLLSSTKQIESSEGVAMSEAKAAGKASTGRASQTRPPRVRSANALRMTPTQARSLAALKSRRAARLSSEFSAAKRRLVTSIGSLALVLLVVGLAAFSLISWWFVVVPALLLAGTLVASRRAGIRTERAGAEENRKLRELEDAIRTGREVRPVTVTVPAAQDRAQVEESAPEEEVAVAEAVEVVAEPVAEVAAEIAEADSPASEMTPSPEPTTAAEESRGWSAAAVPAPSYAKKKNVSGRQVHADTDLIAVVPVAKVPGRPVAASTDGAADGAKTESATAMQPSVAFDLESVLDSRRAAQ